MQTFKYFHSKGPKCQKLFRTWHEILKWYEDSTPDDLPYWYLERTNIGHLALAAYQLSGYSYQEFSCKKGKGANKMTGRADLHIYVPSEYTLNIEAKQLWCALDLTAKSKKAVERKLKEAIDDCERLADRDWLTGKSAALLFILPYEKFKPLDDTSRKKSLLNFKRNVCDIARQLKANFVAVHFASIKSSAKAARVNKCEWCPGIAVLGVFVKKSLGELGRR